MNIIISQEEAVLQPKGFQQATAETDLHQIEAHIRHQDIPHQ